MKIILASQSPRRKYLLRKNGFHVLVQPSQSTEHTHLKKPSALVKANAKLKARDIARAFTDGCILGADTIVYCRGKIIGKPRNRKEAARFLQRLQGKNHYVYTGVCLIWPKRKKIITFYDKTKITFKPMSRNAIRLYHKYVNPLDKAGAYAIHQKTSMILEKCEGSFSNVVGLPVEKLKKVLRKAK